ncbi:Sensor histidine kinase [Hyphodiscus hymeniophilus]|uniref:Sensor histidine kinase n=1 Tax=Hyphodiscus hymeniophilus TaxID=353542 RepID=A0A9P6VEX1_9HELO|nr:Sensor histidine kinase [Hyphodiscus hymeniophilus]
MKKQQERFIDMTSHEMRNPLSALIGCADEIIDSLSSFKTSGLFIPTNAKDASYIDEALEAAETIIYCAMHQKRIIDDILTLSRLDSNLLLVSPVPSQPVQLVRSALKMFEAESKRSDTVLDFVEHQSLRDLQIDWTLLDPSRVLQVLINLVTNAIKFTRTELRRHITITMDASLGVPSDTNNLGVQYVQKSKNSADQTSMAEWGDGEVIYLSIAVTDTGRGLSEKEKKNLFHLFKQASPKTYTQYGGSGLGLYISRQLVEMQGGEIGVASEASRGSTFQFYIKTRRTQFVDPTEKPDFQLLVREDALREACANETPVVNRNPRSPGRGMTESFTDLHPQLQNGIGLPNLQSEMIRPMSPATHKSEVFHILVVEDNLVNQKVVSKQLRKAGHVVHVANHGEEALDFIKRSEYWHTVEEGGSERGIPLSVILMDLEMPIMDGTTCVKRIRELQAFEKILGHIPVIAVTANARKDQIVSSLEAGMVSVPYFLAGTGLMIIGRCYDKTIPLARHVETDRESSDET